MNLNNFVNHLAVRLDSDPHKNVFCIRKIYKCKYAPKKLKLFVGVGKH